MSIKTLLDDAAAEATAGLKIDLAAAQRQAERERARSRRWAGVLTAVAVAAVIALIAVLMPGGVFRAVTPVPASSGKPVGLPAHWFAAPVWTPPVTRHPMAAASMVLSAPLRTSDRTTVDGPVLVSADGTGYASLPWSAHDGRVSLSADGRDVAWVTQSWLPGDHGPARAVVHRIQLSDGRQRNFTIPAGVRVIQLLWAQNRLYVAGRTPGKNLPHTWSVAAGSDEPVLLCRCAPVPLGVDGGGRLIQSNWSPISQLAGVPVVRQTMPDAEFAASGFSDFPPADRPAVDRIASPSVVVDRAALARWGSSVARSANWSGAPTSRSASSRRREPRRSCRSLRPRRR
jgi:hypothetical protein